MRQPNLVHVFADPPRMAALGDTFEACTWYRDHWTRDRVILCTATLNPEA